MKTVQMGERDYHHHISRRVSVTYKAGGMYERVPEAAVAAILQAGAGVVVVEGDQERLTPARVRRGSE